MFLNTYYKVIGTRKCIPVTLDAVYKLENTRYIGFFTFLKSQLHFFWSHNHKFSSCSS